MGILEVKNIKKSFGKTKVLKDVSFSLEKGQVLAIIGSSGSGKTTLLRCLNFLETPDEGEIIVNGKSLFTAGARQNDQQIRENRLHFGLVFQNFNLFPQYNVLKNVTLAPALLKKGETGELENRARQLLAQVGLSDKLENYPYQLSGGQQQRVAIARALINRPPVIFADEPTGNLDSHTSVEVMNMFKKLNEEGITVILVTHSQAIAKYAKRTICMSDGQIVSGLFEGGIAQ